MMARFINNRNVATVYFSYALYFSEVSRGARCERNAILEDYKLGTMNKGKTKAESSMLSTFMKLKLLIKSQINCVLLGLCGADSQHELSFVEIVEE